MNVCFVMVYVNSEFQKNGKMDYVRVEEKYDPIKDIYKITWTNIIAVVDKKNKNNLKKKTNTTLRYGQIKLYVELRKQMELEYIGRTQHVLLPLCMPGLILDDFLKKQENYDMLFFKDVEKKNDILKDELFFQETKSFMACCMSI